MKQPNGPQQPNDNQTEVKADIITPAEKPRKQNKTKIRFRQNLDTKAKSNYRGSAENPAHQKFYIHFFIDNSNVNFILYTLSCPKLNSGQLKAYKLMFAL